MVPLIKEVLNMNSIRITAALYFYTLFFTIVKKFSDYLRLWRFLSKTVGRKCFFQILNLNLAIFIVKIVFIYKTLLKMRLLQFLLNLHTDKCFNIICIHVSAKFFLFKVCSYFFSSSFFLIL